VCDEGRTMIALVLQFVAAAGDLDPVEGAADLRHALGVEPTGHPVGCMAVGTEHHAGRVEARIGVPPGTEVLGRWRDDRVEHVEVALQLRHGPRQWHTVGVALGDGVAVTGGLDPETFIPMARSSSRT
jgi:hypothetical protein